jgi:hypothetical protein
MDPHGGLPGVDGSAPVDRRRLEDERTPTFLAQRAPADAEKGLAAEKCRFAAAERRFATQKCGLAS